MTYSFTAISWAGESWYSGQKSGLDFPCISIEWTTVCFWGGLFEAHLGTTPHLRTVGAICQHPSGLANQGAKLLNDQRDICWCSISGDAFMYDWDMSSHNRYIWAVVDRGWYPLMSRKPKWHAATSISDKKVWSIRVLPELQFCIQDALTRLLTFSCIWLRNNILFTLHVELFTT